MYTLGMNKSRLLIIDDDPETALEIKKLLKSEEYEIFYAANGEEGLKKLGKVKPDIILLDLVLPGHSGFQIAQTIRAMTLYSNTPIIAISFKKEDIDKHVALKSGINEYMEKPLDYRKLVFTIRDILASRRSSNQS
jgi:DNA-binding response OmpR family regulator